MHCPPGFATRPRDTGWYASFGALSGPQGGVGYAENGWRFMGATFDASGLYRFNAIQRMLKAEGLTTTRISAHVKSLQERLIEGIAGSAMGGAGRLNRPGDARFLAFRSSEAQRWSVELKAKNCITDVRGDVIRVGLGIYHDEADIAAFAGLASELS